MNHSSSSSFVDDELQDVEKATVEDLRKRAQLPLHYNAHANTQSNNMVRKRRREVGKKKKKKKKKKKLKKQPANQTHGQTL